MAQRGRKSAAALAVLREFPPKPAAPTPVVRPSPPPDGLSPEMREWWGQVTKDYVFDTHHLKLLEAACRAWDRMTQAGRDVAENGMTYVDSKDHRRPNPAIAIERDSRVAFARLVRELRLDHVEEEKPKARTGYGFYGR